ncbi:Lactose transport system permease protein LacG [Paenibacillus allorhizoplanae]|uniref:Lactose transport system permease protein LacG n=1 Tax=Paenibacillus allorhizoplanae TaxID=2905648 RepID=A0ABN8H3M4_9BACL|nr:carbohydrate ABC transporter permease [Paenibacillus allorhizoplanae]CAH1226928.1 Lactose transport system permease protein LacG [Paenibacillus allorhizoplanae]
MSLVVIKTKTDRALDILLYTVLTMAGLVTLFPFYYVIIMSVTPIIEVLKNGGFVLMPSKFTLVAYKAIFQSALVPRALQITAIITIVGTACNLLVTTLLAYPLSKKWLPGRNIVLMMIVFTLIFTGGMIPTYLVVKQTGLLNSIWALIIPSVVSTFNLLIMKSFFESLSEEIQDAAKIDGCNDMQALYHIVLPLCKPILATLMLFYGVTHWNEFFNGIMYMSDPKNYPLQVVLRNMLQQPQISQELLALNPEARVELPPETLRMALVVVSTLPMLVIYPFIQKHFTKGMMLGAIKG